MSKIKKFSLIFLLLTIGFFIERFKKIERSLATRFWIVIILIIVGILVDSLVKNILRKKIEETKKIVKNNTSCSHNCFNNIKKISNLTDYIKINDFLSIFPNKQSSPIKQKLCISCVKKVKTKINKMSSCYYIPRIFFFISLIVAFYYF